MRSEAPEGGGNAARVGAVALKRMSLENSEPPQQHLNASGRWRPSEVQENLKPPSDSSRKHREQAAVLFLSQQPKAAHTPEG